MHELIEQLQWRAQRFGDFRRGWRIGAAHEILTGQQHDATGNQLAAELVDAFAGALLQVGAQVLGGE